MEHTSFEKGKVSIVMTTYNRSHLIRKSIESLLQQTYKNIEIIIVDNGSTDNTPEILKEYETPQYQGLISVFRLDQNRKFSGGANYALDQISGEWFTILDDDDIAYPEAFETMLKVLEEVDPEINAINCNCIDSATGEFSGHGLTGDQYLTIEDTLKRCKGEFWGITKSELLKSSRFNEQLQAYDCTFWYQIDLRAKRYYIDKPLRLYVTDHGPTDSQLFRSKDRHLKAEMHRALIDEKFYWNFLIKYNPSQFRYECFKGFFYLYIDDDKRGAKRYLEKLSQYSKVSTLVARASMLIPSRVLRSLFNLMPL